MTEVETLRLLPVAEIPENRPIRCKTGALDLLVYRRGEAFYVYRNFCPHQGVPLSDGHLVQEALICRRHGAKFDLLSGKCLRLPATEDLQAFPTLVEDDTLFIRL